MLNVLLCYFLVFMDIAEAKTPNKMRKHFPIKALTLLLLIICYGKVPPPAKKLHRK